MEEVLRVAIAGASGIGKHHAKWFHQAGAQVVGFCGSNEASVAATSKALKGLFPFSGRGGAQSAHSAHIYVRART